VAIFRSRAGSGADAVEALVPAGVPQAGQKRASGGRAVLHEPQARSVDAPQAGQNRVPGSRTRPQAWQVIVAS
jgi:hypothetical protein